MQPLSILTMQHTGRAPFDREKKGEEARRGGAGVGIEQEEEDDDEDSEYDADEDKSEPTFSRKETERK
ncbi:unnamed protein product [Phytophthora fragariaefolia]|uniref:Unnamed protein product n=1 Tax=Phytophthora fragariaefolia TaxID=1490495 RepID=A0A9W7CS27_9STRA|nr:unnamed protein product [Phytophthora fragariaefolia]